MAELDGPRWGPAAGGRATGGRATGLVVLCHGIGADGRDLIDLAPEWGAALPSIAFVAPDAPFQNEGGPTGRQWFSVADRTPSAMAAGVRVAAPILAAFIAAECARLGLADGAYALMGFSQGAMTALFTGLRQAAAPRAILAYSGALLDPASLASEARALPPVLLVHGEADDVVPPSRSREAAPVLRAAGIAVETLFIPGLGHGIDQTGLDAGRRVLLDCFGAG